jgi:hypothetical protein
MSWLIGVIGVIGVAVAVIPAALTLQTIPNGSTHYYMIDAGETQIVLNTWGTLHATGYPLYVMIGSAMTAALRAVGVVAAAAPAWVSLIGSALALMGVFALLRRISIPPIPAAMTVALFGLTRTVWIHGAIAEIYSFTLALLVLLLLIAVREQRGRVYWLALVGGVALAHHRALALVAPALLLLAWDDVRADFPRRRFWLRIAACLGLGLLGLLPYLYLPLRAAAGAAWVYGDPSTLSGFLDQFLGREANRFFGFPASWDAFAANVALVAAVIDTDLTLPGIGAGIAGLLIGVVQRPTRRVALALIVCAASAFAFHALLYSDVLSTLILLVTLPLACGWALLLQSILAQSGKPGRSVLFSRSFDTAATLTFALGFLLYLQNQPFIRTLTSDPTGLEAIATARGVPDEATLMLPWGVHHFAVGFARDVSGEIGGFALVDHNADLRALLESGRVVTFADTVYNQGMAWWEGRVGAPVSAYAAAPQIVELALMPRFADTPPDEALTALEARVVCADRALVVTWVARETPTAPLSVFVHLLDAAGALVGQADQGVPVYGWRPATSWQPGEAVRDVYPLPDAPTAVSVRFGLYRAAADGFENLVTRELPMECAP